MLLRLKRSGSASIVPGARLHLIEGTDHISIILSMDGILDELLELAGLRLAASR
jgi:hypothetical protein